MSKQVGDYVLVNEEKVERALHGTVTRGGQLSGGVGDNASDEVLLAEYDRLGGLITKNGLKVKTGSFYNFDKRTPRVEPEVVFMTELEGDIIEVSEDEAVAIKVAKEKVEGLKKKKVKEMTENEEEPKKRGRPRKDE